MYVPPRQHTSTLYVHLIAHLKVRIIGENWLTF